MTTTTTSTKKRVDSNLDTQAEVQKQIGVYVKEWFTANDAVENKLWKMVLHFREIMEGHGWLAPKVAEMYREEISRQKDITYKNEDKQYKSLATTAHKVKIVATQVTSKQVLAYMKKNVSFTSIHSQLTNSKKRLEGIANGEFSRQTKIEQKEKMLKEAREGVVNAEEYSKVTETKDKPNTEANKKKATSWTSKEAGGGVNFADKDWKKRTKEILGDPSSISMFYESIIKWANEALLEEDWKKLAERELEKLG